MLSYPLHAAGPYGNVVTGSHGQRYLVTKSSSDMLDMVVWPHSQVIMLSCCHMVMTLISQTVI